MPIPPSKENFLPLQNLPPGNSVKSRAIFFLRTVADLQVASVIQSIKPWLKTRSGSILEVGCGAQPYRHWIPKACIYQGLDWEKSHEYFHYHTPDTTYYHGEIFPFQDGMFENVFHTQVLEHIFGFETFLKECRRVLKPGGSFLCAVPFQARYHYKPIDFWRFTPASLLRILTDAGFKQIQIVSCGNDITVAVYKTVSIFYRWGMSGWLGMILLLFLSPLLCLLLVIGHSSLKLKIGSKDDCLGYAVTANA